MIKSWGDEAWEDYLWYEANDKASIKKINSLIKDIDRNGYANAEPLKGNLSGFYSRNINKKDRLVFCIDNASTEIYILSCKTHYGDK